MEGLPPSTYSTSSWRQSGKAQRFPERAHNILWVFSETVIARRVETRLGSDAEGIRKGTPTLLRTGARKLTLYEKSGRPSLPRRDVTSSAARHSFPRHA